MDKVMAFLMKHIGGAFDWWTNLTGLPTVKYGKVSVNWAMVAFFGVVVLGMVIFLP